MDRSSRLVTALLFVLITAACDRSEKPPADASAEPINAPQFPVVEIADKSFASSGKFFVPAYSHLAMGDGQHQLHVNLAIFNTAAESPIIISSVRYYNRAGEIKKEFLSEAHSLAAMASVEFLLDDSELGGRENSASGFVVEWEAEQPVSEPVVEAVMAQWAGTHAYAFVSQGRKLQSPEPGAEKD